VLRQLIKDKHTKLSQVELSKLGFPDGQGLDVTVVMFCSSMLLSWEWGRVGEINVVINNMSWVKRLLMILMKDMVTAVCDDGSDDCDSWFQVAESLSDGCYSYLPQCLVTGAAR